MLDATPHHVLRLGGPGADPQHAGAPQMALAGLLSHLGLLHSQSCGHQRGGGPANARAELVGGHRGALHRRHSRGGGTHLHRLGGDQVWHPLPCAGPLLLWPQRGAAVHPHSWGGGHLLALLPGPPLPCDLTLQSAFRCGKGPTGCTPPSGSSPGRASWNGAAGQVPHNEPAAGAAGLCPPTRCGHCHRHHQTLPGPGLFHHPPASDAVWWHPGLVVHPSATERDPCHGNNLQR
mmetsp:Transcript_13978/g.39559  ORF Transcript_13978/g.39559 Transcript_13978/m.39559 type:complete len:234 (+) Transcript_13978:216-917(+)